MRGVIWLVLLFAGAVVAALTFGANDGLVSIFWSGWRLDLSLNFFVLALLAGVFLMMAIVRAADALLSLPTRAQQWRELKRERAAQAALREALGEYFGARYTRAHKAAQRALSLQPDTPALAQDHEFRTLAHLVAAGSLHRLQDRPRRDQQLTEALKPGKRGAALAGHDGARLLGAEWALDDRDAERAAALLGELAPGVARRTQALRLRLQLQRLQREPMPALHTARLLANHQAFSSAAARGLLRSLAFEVLDTAHDAEQLRRAWADIDLADRRDAVIAARAARRAAALGAPDEARQWLQPFWERLTELAAEERDDVALALATACTGIGTDWLPRLESAQRAFPAHGAVQAAVGMAFAQRGLWGKARRPLEQAAADARLAAATRRAACRQLAALAREEGDEARAVRCEQQAAAID